MSSGFYYLSSLASSLLSLISPRLKKETKQALFRVQSLLFLQAMASLQLSAPGMMASTSLVATTRRASTFGSLQFRQEKRCRGGLAVKAATVVTPKTGAEVVYSKYAGTEIEFDGLKHLILKEDDIIGVLETEDVKDLKPLSDRVLIKVAEVEDKTAGGLLLTEATKEKPSIGTVVAVGPGALDDEGKREPLNITPGSTVLYSKYAGSEFKSSDDSDYIALRASDVMAVLS
ncbi:10 kDa chaperonin [Rhynchospora pubera]|uniref:20 kDa chaperonin, chloroplastic n=1 Tax=Rhynchospora pubera TaxID=906938 RepID=A0AAV8H5A9_9POAL|nr:10 kDa chaperonin [Rhynchospora pubera]